MYQSIPMYPYAGYNQYNMAQIPAKMDTQYGQMPPAQMSATAPMQNVTWIPVAGIQGAKEHIVQPGNTAWLMDNNEAIFYVKTADNLGVTTLKAYRFTEIGTGATPPAPADPAMDPAQYVRRAEFEDLKAQFDKLISTTQKPPGKAEKGAQNG